MSELKDVSWASLIPDEQWGVYERVIGEAEGRGLRFAIGGGIAFSHYANRWRNTKDLDLYVLPGDRKGMVEAVRAAGMVDYFEVHDYDRNWIFRSHDGHGVIVDIIWQMANYHAEVDEGWLTRGEAVRIRGKLFQLIPPEELMWAKLFVMQRDRCDWGDLLNILYVRGAELDWAHLLTRLGNDTRLLAGLLEVFAWTCADAASQLPVTLWETLGIVPPSPALRSSGEGGDKKPLGCAGRTPVQLLDSRDWFGPNQPNSTEGVERRAVAETRDDSLG